MASLPLWMRVGLAGMLCVALSSGVRPWIDAASGAFVPADIAQDAAAVRLFVAGANPYGPEVRDLNAELIGLPAASVFPHFPHPPFSLIVSLPLAVTSFPVGAALWFGFTIALVFLFAVLLEAEAPVTGPMARWGIFALLLAWPPILYNLEKGQWSILLAVLLALAGRAIRHGRFRATAAWAATAASVKVFPVVMGLYFLARAPRVVGWFVGTGVALTALPLLWIGPHAFAAFVRESGSNMPYWESFPLVMFSIHGVVARLFIGGKWAEPLIHAPLAALLTEGVALITVLGLALWLTVQARRGNVDDGLAFSSWLVLLPMVNPQSLGHNGVMLALPLMVIGRALISSSSDLFKWGWAVALVLVSVPKQTVWRLATPPVQPLEGLAVSALPTWGALLLFGITVVVAKRGGGVQGDRHMGRKSVKIGALPTDVTRVIHAD